MSKTTDSTQPPVRLPAWRKLTGLASDADEQTLTPEAFRAAGRKLIAEAERLSRAEFAAKDIPAGERTVFWDPLATICRLLEISRTKLSRFSMEIQGLRAHELCDRIKAKSLKDDVKAYVEMVMTRQLEAIGQITAPAPHWLDPDFQAAFMKRQIAFMKSFRTGPHKLRWAVDLGYPNPSRLAKACVLAHGMSIDEVEAFAVRTLVQKFLDERCRQIKAQPVAKPASESAPPPSKILRTAPFGRREPRLGLAQRMAQEVRERNLRKMAEARARREQTTE